MSKKKNDNQKTLTKSMATVLSATIAATSVISVLPTNIASADEASAIAAVNTAATATEMRSALAQADLALNLTGYDLLSTTGKDIVALKLIDFRTANGNYSSANVVQQELNKVVVEQQNLETLQNAIAAVNTAGNATALRTALEDPALGLILTTYNNLSTPGGKQEAAQLLFNYIGSHGNFSDQASIQNQFNIVVQATLDNEALAFAVKNVNDATDAAAIKIALEDAYLGLVLISYHNLSLDDQAVVAQQLYDFKSNNAFSNKAAIQTKLNALVSQRTQDAAYAAAVKTLNDAIDATATKSALEASDLGLELTEYYKLTAAHKLSAAQKVLAYKVANGSFANQSSIQAALSLVVADEQVAQAVDVVNAAGDANSIKSALTASALKLSLTAYNVLLTADKDAVSALVLANRGFGFADKAAVQAALDAAIATNAPIAAVNLAADATAAQTALEAIALGLNLGNAYPTWEAADKAAVANELITNRPVGGYVNVAAVQATFNIAVNARTAVAAVNSAVDEAAIQVAVGNAALGLTLGADYTTTWLNADRTAVAAHILLARPSTGFVDQGAIQASFNAALAARASVAAVNTALDEAAILSALQSETLDLDLGELTNWKVADQEAVAEFVRAARPGTGYVNKASVQASVDLILAVRKYIAAVNVAGDATAIQAALENPALGLNLGVSYSGWQLADKTAVATAILNARDVNGYENLAEIQSAFDAAVLKVVPLADVNGAGNATVMRAALESGLLVLNLGQPYTNLTDSSKTAVAAWVLSNRPAGGYTDKIAVQAALDMAIAIQYVNIAVNAADMRLALEDPTLNLTLGAYAGWGNADKNAVTNGVITARAAGYLNKATIQAALDSEIVARLAVAAVNLANAETMQNALEADPLELQFGVYRVWNTADKEAVAAAVFTARPTDGYVSKAAVQVAFDNALTARTSVANVNLAADNAVMRLALESGTLGLAQGVYASWSTADKNAVAEAVRLSRPRYGFVDKAAVQAAFNTAVFNRIAVAQVNSALINIDMKSALTNANLGITLGAYSNWRVADQDAIATAVIGSRPAGGYINKDAVQTALDDAIALRLPVASVNIAVTAAAGQAALENAALGLDLSFYNSTLAAVDKLAVATTVTTNNVGNGFVDKAAIQLALNNAINARLPVARVNTAPDVVYLKAAVESLGLDLSVYNALKLSDKWLVVAHILEHKPDGGFENAAAVQLALNSAIDADATMAAVNNATSASEMKTALENGDLGLILGNYANWTNADKLNVATYMLSKRQIGGYANVAAVQTTFNSGVIERQLVAAVNIATTKEAAQTALEQLGLTLGAYENWTASDKAAVAEAVRLAIPANGYLHKPAIQLAFDLALTNRQAVAAVNIAQNAAALQAALEDQNLSLALGVYEDWLAADQAAVAAAVLTDRLEGGYTDIAVIQAIFNLAVAGRSAVANVNLASDAEESQAALEDASLGLILGSYEDWTDADKEAVASTVVTTRPTDGYVDKAAVQTAFNNAIAARAAVAAVNTAEDAAAMQAALDDAALGLNHGVYANWTAADKIAVAEAVLEVVPGTGFVNPAAVQTAFNAAVLGRTVVANMNIALTAASIQIALQDVQLNLDLSVYNTLGINDKRDVSSKVLASRPTSGFVSKAAIQTALDTALDAGTLNRDLNALNIQFAIGDTASRVIGDIELPAVGAEGSTIVWNADLPSIVDIDGTTGTITRPAYVAGDATVTLTAVLTYKGESKTKEFVIKVIKQSITDTESVATDKASLNVGFGLGDSAAGVTQNLTLPTTGANGTTINWVSSNGLVILGDGTIKRPAKTANDEIVTLTATITKNGALQTKEFTVNVLKLTTFDAAESVATDTAALNVVFGPLESAAGVTQNVGLPKTGANGTTITWSSDKSTVIDEDGTVTRPAKTASDVIVTLTATITKNGVVQIKEFKVNVLKLTAFSQAESVATDTAALNVGFEPGDTAAGVTQDLTLLEDGANGTKIRWSSNEPLVIAENGKVTRPAKTASDVIVTLTATITKGDKQETKEFKVNVLKLTTFSNAESVATDTAALNVVFGDLESSAGVTQDLTLPIAGANGTTIAWSSDESLVVAVNGKVTRPAKTANDVIVTLTATITKGDKQETKEFKVNVLKLTTFSNAESVATDTASLNVGFEPGDTVAGVTQKVTLPKTGLNGTTITWSSSNTNVIATNGTVTRPAKTASDVIVTLTATIEKNGVQETKKFTVNVLKLTVFSDVESVATDTASLNVGFLQNDTAAGVTQNVVLPTTGVNGTQISWSSSNTNVIATNGTVTRPAKTASDVNVTLTATITKGDKQETKKFTVNVLKLTDFSDAESVTTDTAALSVGFEAGDTAAGVTQDLSLPETGSNGTTITWSSSNETVIAEDGTVTRPANTASNVIVKLTATITKGDEQETKEFTVNVLKLTAFNDNESVHADKASLSVGYVPGDTAAGVTQNVTLPQTGSNGTTITWSSSNETVIAEDGKVTRPANTASNVIVTLTATITKGDEQETKEFTVNVLKLTAFDDIESVEADKAALNIAFASGETSVNVTKNLTLPIVGVNGTTITWSSSNEAFLKSDGTVTRPAHLVGDTTITLTATITKNAVSEQKTFDVIVLKNGQTAAPAASSILIMNNVTGQNDLIQVSGLLSGDIVNVYSSEGDLIGTATVASDATSASLQITQFGVEAGSVKVTVTRGALDESDKVTVNYAKEGTKQFTISGNKLVTTNGVSATVTVTPTAGTAHIGKEVVVFQLMKGTEPISIVVLEKDIVAAEKLTAHFNVSGSGYSVKVFVVDSYSGSFTEVGNSLASAIVLE